MKTKNLVLVGIAVCAILLASPALASAGYSKIYGNANEDDVLDMRDVTYIKLVIFGKKPATTLADANYDGKISMLDVGQTKLIILGKEKKLTLVDMADRVVTINRPVERVVALQPPVTRMIIGFGDADKIVALGTWSHKYAIEPGRGPKWQEVVAELRELLDVGSGYEPNIEVILSLEPDVVIPYAGDPSRAAMWDRFQKDTGIPVAGFDSHATCDGMFEEIKFIGTVLGKEKRAEELISYFKEDLNMVTDVTSKISESEKPTVLFLRGEISRTTNVYELIDLAGGINVARECTPTPGARGVLISKEQIIKWNPDIILIHYSTQSRGFTVEDVLSDPDLQIVSAIKNRKVYHTPGAFHLVGADPPRVITETFYMAKLFYPDKFDDLDVEKEGNELFERFYGVDDLWTELGEELGFI
ncbi:hypothetical protein CW713_01310 [Methanophagales archaeon]|nr:MAG: hypothetical protein CW713_01310 [Methanophagales archaeon]